MLAGGSDYLSDPCPALPVTFLKEMLQLKVQISIRSPTAFARSIVWWHSCRNTHKIDDIDLIARNGILLRSLAEVGWLVAVKGSRPW